MIRKFSSMVVAGVLALALAACSSDTGPAPSTAQEPMDDPAPAVATDMPAEMPPDATAETPTDAVPDPAADAGGVDGAAVPAPAPTTIAVGEPNPGAPGVVDASCRTDADCAIKDVGSCCGYRPACVNTASPTFPEQVKAKCAQDGRVGICGFPAITGCKCNAGKCEGTGAELTEQVR